VEAVPTLLQFRRWQKRGVSQEGRARGRLTSRDLKILEVVASCRVLTARQIQIGAGFPLTEHDSRLQRRLTLLRQWGILTVHPDRNVNEPANYLITKECRLGIQLLNYVWGSAKTRRCLTHIGSLEHVLGINDIRVRMLRACIESGYNLSLWQPSKELSGYGLRRPIPDAYFEIERQVGERSTTSAYFLEFEHSTKGMAIIKRKLENYSRLVYGGRYKALFDRDIIPRVLFVFESYLGISAQQRIKDAASIAKQLGVRNARFATLDRCISSVPEDLLYAPIFNSAEVSIIEPLLRKRS
jgi:hypothetical protein